MNNRTNDVTQLIRNMVRNGTLVRETLKQVASKIGISGTFVGMITGVDVREFSMAKSVHGDLEVHAIATVGCGNLATHHAAEAAKSHAEHYGSKTKAANK